MLVYITSTVLGVISGILTGLIPGIHPNTVIFTSLPVYIGSNLSLPIYLSYITGLSISHTFHDFLPAIFLSAPEAESALSTVAAPEMVEKGRGLKAFQYTVYGGLTSLVAISIISVPLLLFLQEFYTFISGFMEYILLFFLVFLILESDNLVSALVIAVFSGSIGIIGFQANINQQFMLVPIFSGLFAVPGVINLLKEDFEIPEQHPISSDLSRCFYGGSLGTLAGLIAGVFPGIGAAVSTSFFASLINDSKRNFLSAMGAVNTSDIIFSLLTLQVLGKARSGVSVALNALTAPSINTLSSLTVLTVFSVIISAVIALKISEYYVKILEKVPLDYVLKLILVVLLVSSFYLTGYTGLLILLVSSLIGFSAVETDNRRLCMAVLILPSILFFAELGIFM